MAEESHRAGRDEDRVGKTCRYMTSPFPDCYCMNISSLNIRKVILYCGTDHTACPIYRNVSQEKTGRTAQR